MPASIRADDPHEEADALLPWYATGQIDARDRATVETHLANCPRCRRQLTFERRLAGEFEALSPAVESGWERLRRRIQGHGAPTPRIARAWAEFWGILTRPGIAALAAAQLALVVVGAATFLSLSRPAYHALGSAPAPASANALVKFSSNATEQDMRDALRRSGASLVEGPTAADAYLVHVPAATRQLALARLKTEPIVELAQPIDGSSE
jgi:anti-sigma factor RsiW